MKKLLASMFAVILVITLVFALAKPQSKELMCTLDEELTLGGLCVLMHP